MKNKLMTIGALYVAWLVLDGQLKLEQLTRNQDAILRALEDHETVLTYMNGGTATATTAQESIRKAVAGLRSLPAGWRSR